MTVTELKKRAKKFGEYSLFGVILKQVLLFQNSGIEVNILEVGKFVLLVRV